jgi:hypothetical protein
MNMKAYKDVRLGGSMGGSMGGIQSECGILYILALST